MKPEQKTELKNKILKRYKLYKLQYSRVRRILKDPFRTIPYFLMLAIAYRHPFKVHYKTLWGDKMSFYLPEGNAIYYYGFFEANLANFFINVLKEGDIFYDVGAHVGYYSILASALVSEKGQVHSFEPTPRTFNSLQENAEPKKNVFVNNRAVMSTESEIEFSDYGPKYSAFNSFQNRTSEEMNFLSKPKIIKVKTISLDAYRTSTGATPTIIKIDAEGAEHIILQAMDTILTEDKPIVTIEVAGENEWKDNCKESIDILINKNYTMFEITLEGYLKPHTQKESYSYDNLVFVHKDKISSVSSLIV
jgi:FkbM family methyltransferase